MKKYLLIMLISSLCIVNAASLVKAKDARAITNKETRILEKKLLTSANGKKAYDGLIRFFNKKISRIASKGYYDSLNITFMKAPKEIENLLDPLSRQEQDMIRSLIIEKLQKNGFKITYNKYWNNLGKFNISVSW